jgi:hypothetical protein
MIGDLLTEKPEEMEENHVRGIVTEVCSCMCGRAPREVAATFGASTDLGFANTREREQRQGCEEHGRLYDEYASCLEHPRHARGESKSEAGSELRVVIACREGVRAVAPGPGEAAVIEGCRLDPALLRSSWHRRRM